MFRNMVWLEIHIWELFDIGVFKAVGKSEREGILGLSAYNCDKLQHFVIDSFFFLTLDFRIGLGLAF